jgi:ribosomal protein S18 acetylase RimI-like enzyme
MAIEYRWMNAEEMEQVLELWVAVYPGTEREAWKNEILSIPGSQENTCVALDGGRVLASALLWIREMNDAAGRLHRAGNVSHVATHPQARRQGHAGRLLELIIERMGQADCAFSTLFTSEAGRPLYEKYFWRTCPLHFWQGGLASVNLPRSPGYAVRSAERLEEPALWEALAEIYADFNLARPFAVQRDVSTWKSFTAYKITAWVQEGASLWLAYPTESPQAVCGYLVAHCTAQGFLIAEMGVKEGHRAAIPNLLHPVIGSYGPGQCLDPLQRIESTELMIRPANPQDDAPGDFCMPPSPGAGMFWLLDQI